MGTRFYKFGNCLIRKESDNSSVPFRRFGFATPHWLYHFGSGIENATPLTEEEALEILKSILLKDHQVSFSQDDLRMILHSGFDELNAFYAKLL